MLGVITEYLIYFNGLLINSTSRVSELVVGDLLPYTDHVVYTEACTEVGCTRSPAVRATTQEDLPQGELGLQALVLSATQVQVYWNAIQKPNGLLYYEVWATGMFLMEPGDDVAYPV